MHVYLIQTPLQSQSACKSHPGGGGVLYLVSEHMVYEKEQKGFRKTVGKLFSKPSIKYFPKKSLVYFKRLFPKKPLEKSLRCSPF